MNRRRSQAESTSINDTVTMIISMTAQVCAK
jgi:hypothetical protein